ncbi:DNA polymerase I [Floccifex sp.]|uniref:DNA polymerase I n=1 Tax=Floccifex sp. TaxID=2815810 RepID=UPI002A75F4AA|nr:DNA polymerase I [Floccifex sp.]MDD7281733.1 DNA polymerase I [Erysipelotrichaceae bacterium]MDY2957585.1 DNA polymerase I [Floccifex sp.]
MNNLLLIDGNSMLFRAYYATLYGKSMTTSNGIPTNAVFSFILMMNKAIDMIQPDSILVAFDAGKSTFRHKKYEAYKGTRKPLDDELKVQFPIVREFLDAAGIMRYESEDYEADDIIGSMALKSKDIQTTILTSDRDLLQLVDSSTNVLLMKKGLTEMDLMNVGNFEEKYGLKPEQIIDLKGLMGDASDNIPGVAGVGEKTATKLLQTYGSVENVYENIDQVKGKLKEKLINDKDKAFLSKELATIYRNMDFPFEMDACEFKDFDEHVSDFYKKYEMYSFVKTKETKKMSVTQIKHWKSDNPLFMAVCTNGSYLDQKLYGFISCDENEIYFEAVEDALEDKEFKQYIQKECITWDAKEMMHLCQRYGFDIPNIKHDMHIASFLLHSQATNTDDLLQTLKIELPESFHELSKKVKDKEAFEYNRTIAVYGAFVSQLNNEIEEIFEKLKNQELWDLYQNIELPLIPVLFNMENEGISVNENILDEINDVVDEKIDSLSKEIYGYAHMVFNINSPKQLANVLYDELNLPSGKKRSTSADVLEKLQDKHPIVPCLLEYRKYAKIKSTYIDGISKHIKEDGKIHTCFNQTMTQTGRLSSSDPNLQNISVRDEQGKEIRKAFVARDGYQLLSADYSQIELRILAHMANEKNMIEAFNEGVDIHTQTATKIFMVNKEDVTSSMRRIAKTVNFGIVYGQTEFGLASQLNISRKEASEFMKTYFASFPAIHSFMNEIIAFCQEHGYVKTMFNRRREISEINDKNFMTREFGKRAAMNAPVQGSAADLIKIAMIKVYERMNKENVKSKLLLQIHDELIFEVPDDEIDLMVKLVTEEMENVIPLKVPLVASVAYGKSWYEAK